MNYPEAVRAARVIDLAEDAPLLRIALGGSVNTDLLVPGLSVRLAGEGYAAHVRSTAHDAWVADVLGGGTADVWIIWLAALGLTRGGTRRPDIEVDVMGTALRRLDAAGSQVIVVLPESLPAEADPFSPFVTWRRGVCDALRREAPERTVLVEVDQIVRRRGRDGWDAPRYWEQAKAAAHPDAVTEVAELLGDVIARLLRPAVRGIVVDLDDTLWGGTVGEVGPEGLQLDPDGTGRAFLELQRWLLDLRAAGISLGLASKNDESVVRAAFETRPELLLAPSDFLTFDVSWEPKHVAIARFAATLNVGIDAVCFLDDHPGERDEARTMLPGLFVPELPRRASERLPMLRQSGRFLVPRPDETDLRRVADLSARRQDELSLGAATDLDAYLAGLGMRLECAAIDAGTFDRSLSLLHKTNQFNLTMWRPGAQELQTWVDSSDHLAMSFRLTDRIGDAGIVGIVLAHLDGSGDVPYGVIDAWVLSCRAFNRGVEWAMAERVARWFDGRSVRLVRLTYVPGPRNGPAAGFPARLGLTPIDGTDFEGARFEPPNHHLILEEKA